MSRPLVIVVVLSTFFFYGAAQERDRSKVPEKWKWNLTDLYPTDDRYLRLRKRMLGVDTLHYFDLYAPLVKNVDLTYTPHEAEKLVLASLAPLGSGYVDVVRKALQERWIDLYPTAGKRAGAYSQGGAYDVHPYMLLNYNGKYTDVRTLTHELGHTLQSYLSNKAQPFPTASYPSFTAEVASTFNEALLNDYMLKSIKADDVRLSLLGSMVEGLKGTFFRQAQFAEFELRMHELAERGEPLTGDKLNDLYLEITRRYYGHDKGICIVDEEIKAEWMYIPHFYLNFYVYQYATSFTASTALVEPVLAGDKEATRRYLAFLQAGGSDYAIALLQNAGVDMTTSKPFEVTMNKMNAVMDEMGQGEQRYRSVLYLFPERRSEPEGVTSSHSPSFSRGRAVSESLLSPSAFPFRTSARAWAERTPCPAPAAPRPAQ